MNENANNNSIFKAPEFTLDQLDFLRVIDGINDENLVIERNFRGRFLKTGPIEIPIKNVLDVGQPGLVEYIFKGLIPQRPILLTWVFANKSVIRIADYLLRFKSGSPQTFYLYSHLLNYFSKWCGRNPER